MGPSTPAYKATATRPADCGARRESDPLVMLYSDDLEATAEAVTEGGGTIVEPIAPYPGGRRFQFTDPDGNRLGAYTSG